MSNDKLDTIVGLVLEFAEAYHLNADIIKEMNDRYDTGEPSTEEKIQFLREVLSMLPANSNLVDIVEETLESVDTRNEEAKITKVSSYLLPNGGLVSVYRVDNEMIGDFFVATFDDGSNEVTWGCGVDTDDALKSAEDEWGKYNSGENPFSQVVKAIQS